MRAIGLVFFAFFFAFFAALPGAVVHAQAPAPATAQSVTPADNYAYQPEGRRDPFLSLLGTGSQPLVGAKRADGPGGLGVSEISVRGVVLSKGALIGMIQGPDNKTYMIHQGDKLMDGTIKAVTPQGLIIVQEVNDPLSLVKQREIRKLLRSFEDAKE